MIKTHEINAKCSEKTKRRFELMYHARQQLRDKPLEEKQELLQCLLENIDEEDLRVLAQGVNKVEERYDDLQKQDILLESLPEDKFPSKIFE